MAGLVPAIHVFKARDELKTWMPGTSPGMTRERLWLRYDYCVPRLDVVIMDA
jgi:hypothetical protein